MTVYTILFIVEAIIVLIGFLVGLKRGMAKALVRLAELVIVAIASLLIGRWITGMLSDTLADVLHTSLEDPLKSILLSTPDAEELLLGLVCALILPIIFVAIFAISKLFSLIGLSALTRLVAGKATKHRVLGGLVGAAIMYFAYTGIVVGEYIDMHIWLPAYLAIGFLAAAATEFGDLVESCIKRKIGIKDMGKIMPGHGGILDRIDGTLFASLAVYIAFAFIRLIA
jgi:CDP-diglyceride synthetase